MGTLYLVATPIGNLEDLSPRALRTLREARLIAAEDTRVTKKLVTHFDLHTPLISYFEHNKITRLDAILAALEQGDVALVSDAGTPAINDPGYELVKAALEAGYTVCPIPGPSAPLAALVASGLPTDRFLYLGYLPRRAGERRALLEEVKDQPCTLLFLETPHRLAAALADLHAVLGERQMAVARELTKMHEEIWRGTISGAEHHFETQAARGEITLVVAGKVREQKPVWSRDKLLIAIKFGLKLSEPPSGLAKRLADESGWNRKEIYTLIMDVRKQ